MSKPIEPSKYPVGSFVRVIDEDRRCRRGEFGTIVRHEPNPEWGLTDNVILFESGDEAPYGDWELELVTPAMLSADLSKATDAQTRANERWITGAPVRRKP